MTTTDVAVAVTHPAPSRPEAPAPVPDLAAMGLTQAEAASLWNVCQVLAKTPVFGPPIYGNPGVLMGVALYLHGYGIPISLVSLKRVHVWEEDTREKRNGEWVTVGRKVCMQEDYRLLLGLLHRAGHDCWLEGLDDEKCTFVFIHRDHPGREQRFTYTLAMAARAGLADKPNWRKNPHWMLPAATVRMCARLGAPESTLGIDLGDDHGRVVTPVEYTAIAERAATATPVGSGESQVPTSDTSTTPDEAVDQGGDADAVSAGAPPSPTRPSPYAKAVHIAAHEAGLTDEQLDEIVRYVTGDPSGSANSVTRLNKDDVLAMIRETAEGA